MSFLLFIALAFLSGSIPFGLLIARAKGIDIRQHGSRNIGATNVGRVLGRRLGLVCFALDLLKGFAPTAAFGLASGAWGLSDPGPAQTLAWLAVMGAAVLGHIYSPWVGFRGGKGVATGLGAMLGVYPILTVPAAGAFLVWVLALAAWRYVSLASVLAAASLPVLAALAPWYLPRAGLRQEGAEAEWGSAGVAVAVTALLAVLVIYRHRANLARLRAGTEPRVGRREGSTGPD